MVAARLAAEREQNGVGFSRAKSSPPGEAWPMTMGPESQNRIFWTS
jgi:hypothetical protein